MDEEIIFKPTAFKHGVAEADIRAAFDKVLFDGTVAGKSINIFLSVLTETEIHLKYCIMSLRKTP